MGKNENTEENDVSGNENEQRKLKDTAGKSEILRRHLRTQIGKSWHPTQRDSQEAVLDICCCITTSKLSG